MLGLNPSILLNRQGSYPLSHGDSLVEAPSSVPHIKIDREGKSAITWTNICKRVASFMNLVIASTFKCISWLNGLFFGVNIGVFWKRESRPIKWHQFRLWTHNCFFFCLHIYSLLWWLLTMLSNTYIWVHTSCSDPEQFVLDVIWFGCNDEVIWEDCGVVLLTSWKMKEILRDWNGKLVKR